MTMGPEERALFLILLQNLETALAGLKIVARRHGALLALLRAKGLITEEEYTEAVKAHQAAREVDDALDPEEQERLRQVEELKRMLEEGPS